MNIKLKEFKGLVWNAGLLDYRLFHLVNGSVNVNSLPLLWETNKPGDWADIGGCKYDDYYVQEIQTNKLNTLDILISKNPGINGDARE
ncbi:MAG: hypothetical protein PUJ84_07005 [Mollicutes bacterium]|nr:hypothetical protein [Mollicutes bacterium]